MATRAALVNAARDLNKILDLEPAIDVKQGSADLKAKITEAAELIREGDAITDDTRAVIAELSKPESEQEAGADQAEQAPVEPGEVATKTAKPKTAKAPKVAKEPKASASRQRYPADATIKVLATENPKQKNSAAHARFELYRDGMTCAEFLAAGGDRADLSWDFKKGFISIA